LTTVDSFIGSSRVSRHRNWSALAGCVLMLGGVATDFPLVLTFDPGLHRWLETPALHRDALAVRLALPPTDSRRLVSRLRSPVHIPASDRRSWQGAPTQEHREYSEEAQRRQGRRGPAEYVQDF